MRFRRTIPTRSVPCERCAPRFEYWRLESRKPRLRCWHAPPRVLTATLPWTPRCKTRSPPSKEGRPSDFGGMPGRGRAIEAFPPPRRLRRSVDLPHPVQELAASREFRRPPAWDRLGHRALPLREEIRTTPKRAPPPGFRS